MKRMTKRNHKNYNYLLQDLKRQQRKKEKEQKKKKQLTKSKSSVNMKADDKKNNKEVETMNIDFQKIIENIDLLNSILPELQKLVTMDRKLHENLMQELSVVDTEISDILHAIEFGRFNASEGYKLAKTLQDARNKRREIKSKLEVVDSLQKLKNNIKKPEVNNLAQTVQAQTNRLSKRKSYTIRQRVDLGAFINKNNKSTKEALKTFKNKGAKLK